MRMSPNERGSAQAAASWGVCPLKGYHRGFNRAYHFPCHEYCEEGWNTGEETEIWLVFTAGDPATNVISEGALLI